MTYCRVKMLRERQRNQHQDTLFNIVIIHGFIAGRCPSVTVSFTD